MSDLAYWETTIANGTTTDAIPLDGMLLLSIRCPAGIASVAVQVYSCPTEAGTFLPIYKNGAVLSKTIAASNCIMDFIDEKIFANWIKLVFGATETAKTFGVTAMPV